MVGALIVGLVMLGSGLGRQDEPGQTFDLKTVREKVTYMGREFEAEVTYQLQVNSMQTKATGEQQPSRTVYLRAENRSPIFELRPKDRQPADPDQQEAGLLAAYLSARNHGASESIGAWIYGHCQTTRLDFEPAEIDPNYNVLPNGTTVRTFGHEKVELTRPFVIWRVFSTGRGSTAYQEVEKFTVPAGSIWLPRGMHLQEQFRPDKKQDEELKNQVGGVTLQPKGGEATTFLLPQYPAEGNSWSTVKLSKINSLEYYGLTTSANGPTKVNEFMIQSGYDLERAAALLDQARPVGVDLNRLSFPEFNKDDPCAYNFLAPPGTIWVPDNSDYQVMTTGSAFRLNYSFESSLYASTQIAGFDARTMFAMCLNKDKKEPDGKVRYYPFQPSDPVVRALATVTDKSFRKGPRDQARLWIYTDGATMEAINQRLLPRLTLAAYTQSLYEVVFFDGFTDEEAVSKKLLKAEAIGDAGLPLETAVWAMRAMDAYAAETLADWIAKSGSVLGEWLAGDADAKAKGVALVSLGLNSGDERVRSAMLRQVSAMGDVSALRGKVGSLRGVLYSADAEMQALGLALLPKVVSTVPKDALEHLAVGGASEEVRAGAKGLLGGG